MTDLRMLPSEARLFQSLSMNSTSVPPTPVTSHPETESTEALLLRATSRGGWWMMIETPMSAIFALLTDVYPNDYTVYSYLVCERFVRHIDGSEHERVAEGVVRELGHDW